MDSLLIPGTTGAWAATFDVAGGAAALDYAAGSSAPLRTVADRVCSAYRGGAWAREGVTSSVADASNLGVGYTESAFALGPARGAGGARAANGSWAMAPHGVRGYHGGRSGFFCPVGAVSWSFTSSAPYSSC
jgi:hypothetical protein